MPANNTSETKDIRTTLGNLFNKLGDAVADFSTLDVITLTGDIRLILKGEGNNKRFMKIPEIIDQHYNNTQDLKVVAITHIDFDQDTIQFVKEDMSVEEKDLFELHKQMIESAKTSRLAVLKFIKETVLG